MAASSANTRRFLRPLAASIALLAWAAVSGAQDEPMPPNGEFEAASLTYSIRDKTWEARDVRINRDGITLRADKAVGADQQFREGTCTFSGNVVITNARGNLRAENATVTFRDGRIVNAVIDGAGGAPATFEQKLDDPDTLARGHADTLEYDIAAETVRMRGDAWATDGRDMDIRAQSLIYDIRQQKLTAHKEEQGEDRVRIKINPRAAKKTATQ